MNLSELFIKRPVMTTLIILGIAVFGVMSYRLLPVSNLPTVDFPTISVSASLPGASPETMASSVATPLEKQFSTIAGVTSINSTSSQGSTSIVVQFDLNRSIDAAAQDVQAMITKAARQLPPSMPTPPSYQKVNPADFPILFLVITSDILPFSTVDEYAQLITQRISMVSGVAQAQVNGTQKYAVRVQVDPHKLASYSIGIDTLASAIAGANANLPTGTIYGPKSSSVLQVNGQLFSAAPYGSTIVAYRNGNPVRLNDVARVFDSVENNKSSAYINKRQVLFVSINKQPGSNTVATVDAIRALLPGLREQVPPAIDINILDDRSDTIRASVSDVKFTLVLTVCLVVLAIFVFLRNVSATLIPSLALPASIVATFAVMYVFGYSLDNLSLMALTLCTGFVVDDAIVMLENIIRHMEMGKTKLQAALDGSREVAFTIVSMTLSLAAVFIPILFMGGIIGRLLHEFAVTIGAAILISGFVSISLTPMLTSRFLKPPHETKHGALYRASERGFDALLHAYDRTLQLSLRFKPVTMAVSVLCLVGTVYLFRTIPTGFLPNEDTGRINLSTEAAQGISYEEMVKHQAEITAIVNDDPNTLPSGGFVANGSSNRGMMFVLLKPRAERALSADQVIAQLRPKLAQVPGIRAFMTNPPPITIGGNNQRAVYQLTLFDADIAELYRYAPLLETRIRQLPNLEDVSSDLQLRNPQTRVDIDRDRIVALGLDVNKVETALYNAFGSRQVTTIFAPSNQYQVILEVAPEFQTNPADALSMLYVTGSNGRLIPLNTVTTLKSDVGAFSISHSGQLPAVTISFNLKPGASLGDAVSDVQAAALQVLPGTVSTSFQGAAQAFQESLQGLGLILLMAIVIIYIVLGILYESFTHPLTILSGLPSAGFGALLTLMIFKVDLNLYAFVGIIMLVGLVKKNGIMMVDFAVEAQRQHGRDPLAAIHEACLVRFRPIMMTTMAALVGTLPIALGWGAGAESRRPLGLAVVGGLVVSQFLTLYITPVYYVYIEQSRLWLARRFSRAERSTRQSVPLPEPAGAALPILESGSTRQVR